MKKVRPLNIIELKRLIDKTKEASSQIKNQDILLFLGGTGSGKSTTIHFLAGSRMIMWRQEVVPGKYLEHIIPEEPYTNSSLYNVTISSRAESETRYIHAVPVNLNELR